MKEKDVFRLAVLGTAPSSIGADALAMPRDHMTRADCHVETPAALGCIPPCLPCRDHEV